MTPFYYFNQNPSGFALLCSLGPLLFKPRWDYEDKYENKNEKDAGSNSKMTLYSNNLHVCSFSSAILSILKLK